MLGGVTEIGRHIYEVGHGYRRLDWSWRTAAWAWGLTEAGETKGICRPLVAPPESLPISLLLNR